MREGPLGGRCTVDVLLEPRKKIASTFEYADKAGAHFIVFVAPDEWARGVVAVKDLRAAEGAEMKQVGRRPASSPRRSLPADLNECDENNHVRCVVRGRPAQRRERSGSVAFAASASAATVREGDRSPHTGEDSDHTE